jgi:hypothetical protein
VERLTAAFSCLEVRVDKREVAVELTKLVVSQSNPKAGVDVDLLMQAYVSLYLRALSLIDANEK